MWFIIILGLLVLQGMYVLHLGARIEELDDPSDKE